MQVYVHRFEVVMVTHDLPDPDHIVDLLWDVSQSGALPDILTLMDIKSSEVEARIVPDSPEDIDGVNMLPAIEEWSETYIKPLIDKRSQGVAGG